LSCQWLKLDGTYLQNTELPLEIGKLTFTFVLDRLSYEIISNQIGAMRYYFFKNRLNVTNLEIEFLDNLTYNYLSKEYEFLSEKRFCELCNHVVSFYTLEKVAKLGSCLTDIGTFLYNLDLYFSFGNLKIGGFITYTTFDPSENKDIEPSEYIKKFKPDISVGLQYNMCVGLAENTKNVEILSTEIHELILEMKGSNRDKPLVTMKNAPNLRLIQLTFTESRDITYRLADSIWTTYKGPPRRPQNKAKASEKDEDPSCLSLWTCC
jgi:hypothetical protein